MKRSDFPLIGACLGAWLATWVFAAPVPLQRPIELWQLAPTDSRAIVVFDLKRLLDSGALGTAAQQQLNTPERERDARRIAFFTGSDYRADWQAVMWASTGGDKPAELTVIRGRFDHKRLVEFFHLAEGVTTERYLNIVLHKIPATAERDAMSAAFLSENLLALGAESAVRRAIEVRWNKIPADEKRSDALDGFSRLPEHAFLRAAVAEPLGAPADKNQPPQISTVCVAATALDGLELFARADTAGAPTAAQLKTALEALFGLARLQAAADGWLSDEMLKALNDARFDLQQAAVTFKLRLPRGTVPELLKLLQLPQTP